MAGVENPKRFKKCLKTSTETQWNGNSHFDPDDGNRKMSGSVHEVIETESPLSSNWTRKRKAEMKDAPRSHLRKGGEFGPAALLRRISLGVLRFDTFHNRPCHLNRCVTVCTMLVAAFLLPGNLSADDSLIGVQSILENHCYDCHSSGTDSEGQIDLTDWTLSASDPEAVASVIRVIEQDRMPPEDESQLTSSDRGDLIATLKQQLRQLAMSGEHAEPTRIRRMNRFQYNNAVVDLFDLKATVFTLPEKMMREHNRYFQPATGKMPDFVAVGSRPLGKSQMIEPRLAGVAAFPQDLRAEHGFDNRADHLSLSPLLMESFLKLGRSITDSKDFTANNVGIWASFFAPAETTSQALPQVIRQRLKPFLMKAFRRPVDQKLLNRYTDFVVTRINAGVKLPDAMKAVAAATIASPRFLYLYDQSESTTDHQPNCFDLASRLSFFLWGSIPDKQLLELAASGNLCQDEVLLQQIDRMLKDRKLKRFCDSFPAQWLQLERIISSVPEPKLFPSFYFLKYRNSMHMMLEPLLVFETILIENRPIRQLVDSDFTYRSNRLNNAYGEIKIDSDKLPNGKRRNEVTALTFHRVPVTDRRTGGVITTAAVMTMTSGPERTQPITRGAWMATVIFNDPPEPPPADVPPLEEKTSHDQQDLTLRERLDLHRERADCKGCHEQIDPLGFAFENFSPIGQWRSQYENGRNIDVSGSLFRRHHFSNVVEFKDSILAEESTFASAFVGHLLSFAVARELTAVDQVAIDQIVQQTQDHEFRMQDLIKQVVLSEPFRGRQKQ